MEHTFNWTPTIGDPTFVGWLTVALYLVTAWRCAALARSMHARSTVTAREFGVWCLIAVLFLALAVNKQLDLQSALTELGRVLIYRTDRFAYKQAIQFWFVVGIAIAALVGISAAIAVVWKTHIGTWIGTIGTVIVVAYVLTRAVSFHHIDRFIGSQFGALKWNWVLEISGILIVLLGTVVRQRDLSGQVEPAGRNHD